MVVVGILIALYINNWNEKRKERLKFDQALVEVEKELVMNIQECRRWIDYLYDQDSIINAILFDTLTHEDFENDYNLRNPIFHDGMPNLLDNSYQKLTQVNSSLSHAQDTIKTLLSRLYPVKEIIASDIVDLRAVQKKVIESYRKFSWYSDWRLYNPSGERIDYLVNNPTFKKDVIDFSEILLIFLRTHIEYFEIESADAYLTVYQYLERNNISHMDSLYFQYDANDFRHYTGTYVTKWRSFHDRTSEMADSLVISLENKKLYYTPYYNNGTNTRREIIPISKYNFRTVFGRGFYRLRFDDEGNVIGHRHSGGNSRVDHAKIR